MGDGETALTLKQLNKEIVNFRKIVKKSQVRKLRDLLRRGQIWRKSDDVTKKRRGNDLVQMALVLKRVDKDELTKFALQNTKTIAELRQIEEATIKHRALFHLLSDKPFVAAVDSFRERYPEWFVEVPFLLQRLGLKFAKKREGKDLGANLKDLQLAQKEGSKKKAESDGDESDEDDINTLGGIVEGSNVEEEEPEAEGEAGDEEEAGEESEDEEEAEEEAEGEEEAEEVAEDEEEGRS
ncbi:hypothetical protein L596_026340 [Steinernema carpocapsae]|uniref:Serum response factor-binding protein 1 n=1 Tax=Steinernema carpocapsae TaxID=34508 RepID=A0A4U5M164_STECR|nr:hypothetical protein L596_026340 [Steinernema carpocapsae]